MEQRMSLVTLGVGDLDRSVAFYREVVGWTPEPGPPGVAFFNLGGIVFGLYPHSDLAEDMNVPRGNAGSGYEGFSIAYNARTKDEVDAVFADLAAKGATIVKAPEEAFWGGYSGYFADPDGHAWEVAWNPHSPLGPDGSFVVDG
jgi:hypothetical protein